MGNIRRRRVMKNAITTTDGFGPRVYKLYYIYIIFNVCFFFVCFFVIKKIEDGGFSLFSFSFVVVAKL